jgi:hypothetical protein
MALAAIMDKDDDDDDDEAQPLVGAKPAAEPSGGGHDAPPSDTLGQEVCVVWALAWPQSLSFLLAMMSQQANIAMVGHLGAAELGASALASMFCNVTGFSIAYGGLTALDTLGAQAYGAGQFEQVGVLAQRALAIVTLLCFPVAALWCFAAGPLLALIGIEPAVASLTITYCRVFALGLWPTLAVSALHNPPWPVIYASMAGDMTAGCVVQTRPPSCSVTYRSSQSSSRSKSPFAQRPFASPFF